jgi:hypothetical protein
MPVAVEQRPKASEVLRALSPLEKVDYEEMFVANAPDATRWSAERWARAAIEEAPATRIYGPKLWRAVGLRMGPRPSAHHVNGWTIAACGDDWIRLESASSYTTIHVVVRIEPDEVQEAMFIRYDGALAAPMWSAVGPMHRKAMPGILRYAVKTLRAT